MVFALAGDSTTTTSIWLTFLGIFSPDQFPIRWPFIRLKARIPGLLDVARCVPPTLVRGESSLPAQATNGIGAPIRQPLPVWARAIRRVVHGFGQARRRPAQCLPRAYKSRVCARPALRPAAAAVRA